MASTPVFVPHDPAQAPTCSWRGVAVDPTRSFWPVPSLELILSLMARYRFSVMRWRLCAGSACLLPVPGFPFDTGAGARPATPATPRTGLVHAQPARDTMHAAPRTRGYYSDANIRHLVDYAAARNIRLVPELCLPSHAPEHPPRPRSASSRPPSTTRATYSLPRSCPSSSRRECRERRPLLAHAPRARHPRAHPSTPPCEPCASTGEGPCCGRRTRSPRPSFRREEGSSTREPSRGPTASPGDSPPPDGSSLWRSPRRGTAASLRRPSSSPRRATCTRCCPPPCAPPTRGGSRPSSNLSGPQDRPPSSDSSSPTSSSSPRPAGTGSTHCHGTACAPSSSARART